MPVFNAGQWLERCLKSILNQTYDDFEVIMVDDGSTDGSDVICDKFAKRDHRFKAFHIKNGGVSSARNFGLSQCNGEWIAFVDADDILPPDSLRERVTAAIKYNVDLVICNITEVMCDGCEIMRYYPFSNLQIFSREDVIYKILPYALLPNNFFGGCCNKLYKRSIFVNNSITFPRRQRAEDWVVNISYLENANSAVALTYTAYYYLRNSTSAMSKPYANQIELWNESWKIKNYLINKYNFDIDKGELYANTINEVVEYAIKLAYSHHLNSFSLAKKSFKYCKERINSQPVHSRRLFPLARLVKPFMNVGLYLITFGIIKLWVSLKK